MQKTGLVSRNNYRNGFHFWWLNPPINPYLYSPSQSRNLILEMVIMTLIFIYRNKHRNNIISVNSVSPYTGCTLSFDRLRIVIAFLLEKLIQFWKKVWIDLEVQFFYVTNFLRCIHIVENLTENYLILKNHHRNQFHSNSTFKPYLLSLSKSKNLTNNKAGYTSTPVACGWAGALFEVSGTFGQEQ